MYDERLYDDRTVHARYPGMEVVRYERAGKWWLECTDPGLRGKRQQVSIDGAVQVARRAVDNGGEVHFGRPGGLTFDRKVHNDV